MREVYIVTSSYPRYALLAFENKNDALALSEKVNKHNPEEFIEAVGLVPGYPIAYTNPLTIPATTTKGE